MTKINVSKDGHLEKMGIFNFIIRLLTIPILNVIPDRFLRKTAKASSKDANNILENVGSAHALEIMYSRNHRKLFSRGIFQGIADWYWHHVISQLKAVRNRLRIVENSLEHDLKKRIEKGEKDIKILTIGGGSSRAIIQTISRLLNKNPGIEITVTNLDRDPTVIDLGKKIAESFNVSASFKWIIDTASKIDLYIEKGTIDIIEMVGLMDYFNKEKSILICNKIFDLLKEDGLFIVGNICPNFEKKFVEKVGWPKMDYKTQDDFYDILYKAGFNKKPYLVFEPLKVHIIGLARK